MNGCFAWMIAATLAQDPGRASQGTDARVEDVPMERVMAIPVTQWTPEERAVLVRGEPSSRHWRDVRGRARGLSAILVSAPAPAVWKQIVDIDAYVDFMPYVTASYVSTWEEAPEYTHIVAGYQLTTMGVNTRYKLDNRWYADKGVLVFDIVPDGTGPISAGDGWWRVSPWDSTHVLLEYSVDMTMQWWVPSALERKAADRLPLVVRLLKRRAETAARG